MLYQAMSTAPAVTAAIDQSQYPTADILLTLPVCVPLSTVVLQALVTLLFVQDSIVLRKSIAMLKLLLSRAAADLRCAEVLGQNAFQSAVSLLLVEVWLVFSIYLFGLARFIGWFVCLLFFVCVSFYLI